MDSNILNWFDHSNESTEENFPIDTVKQIFYDIEKLFDSDDSCEPCSSAKNVQPIIKSLPLDSVMLNLKDDSLNESNRFGILLNSVMNNDKKRNLSLFDYTQLCSFELANLEEELEASKHLKSIPSDEQSMNKARNFKIGSLHIMLWNLFNLHEKILCLLDNDHRLANKGDEKRETAPQFHKLETNLVEVVSYWNEIAEKVKDSITMTKTADDIECAVDKEHLWQLWQLTRLIRTMFWALTMLTQTKPIC